MIPVTTGECFTLPDPIQSFRRYYPLVAENGDVLALFTLDLDPLNVWVHTRRLWSTHCSRAPMVNREPFEPRYLTQALTVALLRLGLMYYEVPEKG